MESDKNEKTIAQNIINIIKKYIQELKKEKMDILTVYLYGSYAKGTNREDSDIDIAIVCKNADVDIIEKNIKLWKIAVRVDTRISPMYSTQIDFNKDYIPIVTEIKKGLELKELAP